MQRIRYFKLKNDGWFVARIAVNYEHDDGGNASKGTYKPTGYHDICAAGERTLDLTQTTIPSGSIVTLVGEVVWGTDQTATENFIFDMDAGATAVYRMKNSLFNPVLKHEGTK